MRLKSIFIAITLIFTACGIFAEQVTTVGIVDITRVYNDFYFESEAVRELERMKEEIQYELEGIRQEIDTLKERRIRAQNNGNDTLVLRLDREITEKTNYYNDVLRIRTKQLKQKQESITGSEDFLQKLNEALAIVGESEGYTVIIRKRDEGLMWYSTSVEVTDLVIDELRRLQDQE